MGNGNFREMKFVVEKLNIVFENFRMSETDLQPVTSHVPRAPPHALLPNLPEWRAAGSLRVPGPDQEDGRLHRDRVAPRGASPLNTAGCDDLQVPDPRGMNHLVDPSARSEHVCWEPSAVCVRVYVRVCV